MKTWTVAVALVGAVFLGCEQTQTISVEDCRQATGECAAGFACRAADGAWRCVPGDGASGGAGGGAGGAGGLDGGMGPVAADARRRPPAVWTSATELGVGEVWEIYVATMDEVDRTRPWAVRFTGRVDGVEAVWHAPAVANGTVEHESERWTAFTVMRLGPFEAPFGAADLPSTFEGLAEVGQVDADGGFAPFAATVTSLRVLPSVVIERFEPLGVDCGAPVPRVHFEVPYRLRAAAVGLVPDVFTDRITTPANLERDPGAVTARPEGARPAHSIGEDEALFFDSQGRHGRSYGVVEVVAERAEGDWGLGVLPVVAVPPIEVLFYDDLRQSTLAERLAPEPYSECFEGDAVPFEAIPTVDRVLRQHTVQVIINADFAARVGLQAADLRDGVSVGPTVSRRLHGALSEHETALGRLGVTYRPQADPPVSSRDGTTWSWARLPPRDRAANEAVAAELRGAPAALGAFQGVVVLPNLLSWGGGRFGGRNAQFGVRAARQGPGDRVPEAGGVVSARWGRHFGSASYERIGGAFLRNHALTSTQDRRYDDFAGRDQTEIWALEAAYDPEEVVSYGMSASEEYSWQATGIGVLEPEPVLLPPGTVGQYFVQNERRLQDAEIVAYDACGLAHHVGIIRFNSWTWHETSFQLVVAPSCEAIRPPASERPVGCFVPPCAVP